MANGSFVVAIDAQAHGLDQVKSDAERLKELLEEAQAIIERLGESEVTISIRPSRRL